uniref:Glycoprotein n=1 Tax=Blattella germanica chuvirus 1 TaxID=3133478 RepID=A0AAT9JFV2_9VIRU
MPETANRVITITHITKIQLPIMVSGQMFCYFVLVAWIGGSTSTPARAAIEPSQEIAEKLVGYDCQASYLSIASVATNVVEQCKATPVVPNVSMKMVQVVQLNDIAALSYRLCKVVITRSITHCGMHSHSSAVRGGLATYIRPLGNTLCNQVHETGVLAHGISLLSDLQVNATTIRLIVLAGTVGYDGKCQGASYSDEFGSWDDVVVHGQLEITLTTGMALYDLSSNDVVLPDGIRCKYLAGGCFKSSSGEVYWKKDEETACDLRKYSVLYQGMSTWTEEAMPYDAEHQSGNLLVSVENQDRVFSFILDKRTHLCQFSAYATEHPRIFIVPALEGAYPFPESLRHSHDVDMMIYVNSKFVYVERHIRTQITELYKDIMARRCEDKRQHLSLSLAVARSSPNDFAYSYTEAPGYTALLRGELIYIAQCVPTPVVVRRTEQCFQELPVTYNGEPKFLAPQTRVLVDQGTEIPCSTIIPSGFHVFGQWFYLQPHPTPGLPPHILSPNSDLTWNYKSTKNLASSGIYTDNDMSNLRKQLIFPIERPAIENILVRQVSGQTVSDQGINTGAFFKPDLHEQITNSVTMRLWGWLGNIGQYMSVIVGVIWCFKLLHYLFNVGVNGAMLFATFGWGFRLIAALSESLSNCLLHRNLLKKNDADRSQRQSETLPTGTADSPSSVPPSPPAPTVALPGSSGDAPGVAGQPSTSLYPDLYLPKRRY